MKNYYSNGHKDVLAESMKEAANIFANRKARAIFGRWAYARTCETESWSQDNSLGEFNAFIGYQTGAGETTGKNVRFTVEIA